MAEGIAKALLQERSFFRIKSAGLCAIPGNPPAETAVRVSSNHGIPIAHHRAQRLSLALTRWADIIFCMERSHGLQVRKLSSPAPPIRLIGEGVPGIPDEVSDPYGGTKNDYEQTFFHLTKAIAYHFGLHQEGREHDRKAEALG